MKHSFSTDDVQRGNEYLLVCTARSIDFSQGTWHFSLESVDGSSVLEAHDDELGDLNRLTLLAAVRGLEAIDGPASVTLLSHSRYLIRSLSDSLPRWRDNNFVWEHFGRRIDVQHADLWRRVDSALAIHRVEACLVSSRLVSRGESQPTITMSPSQEQTAGTQTAGTQTAATQRAERQMQQSDQDVTWRIDGAHSVPPPPSSAPTDRLRQWLLSGSADVPARPASRRFTAADLMETA